MICFSGQAVKPTINESVSASQRHHPMPSPRPRAGFVHNIEFAAGRRAALVNSATHLSPHFTTQGHAARRFIVGSAHAPQIFCQRQCHFRRHALSPGKSTPSQFNRMKINPKGGTAGSTGLATHLRFPNSLPIVSPRPLTALPPKLPTPCARPPRLIPSAPATDVATLP